MGVPASAVFVKYTANGATTVFAYPFKLQSTAQLDVLIDDVIQSSGFTVSGVGNDGGGNTTFGVAPTNGAIVYFRRSSDFDRDTTYTESNFLVGTVNDDQDYQTMLAQELEDSVSRSFHVEQGSDVDVNFPDPESNKLIAWNAGATALVNVSALAGSFVAADYKVTSVAAMKALTGVTNNAIIQTLGYYLEGDGGHGTYRYDSASAATDNGGTVIAPTSGGGRFLLIYFGKVHVKQFGVKGDNFTTDDTAAITAACANVKDLDFGDSSCKYKMAGTATLQTGATLFGEYAEIKQTTNNAELFNYESKSDIAVYRLVFRGVGTDFNNTDSIRASAFYGGTSGSRIKFHFNEFYNFGYTPVRAKANTDVTFNNNYVEGPGSPTLTSVTSGANYGFLADSGCSRVIVCGNTISKHAQGVRIEGVAGFDISGNNIFDIIGQHGCYLGSSLTDGRVAHNHIKNVDLIGIKTQAANTGTDNRRITIVGNTLDDCGDQGILTSNGAGGSAQAIKNKQVTIIGNTIRTCAGSAINVQNTIGGAVANNCIDAASQAGINLSASSRVTVESNIIENCAQDGIRDESACTEIIVKTNQIRDCATANTAGAEYGIFVQSMTDWIIDENIISDAAAKMKYGIYLSGGDQTTVTVKNNQILNATDYAIRWKNATDAAREFANNLLTGTLGNAFNDPALKAVASAATITLPTNHKAISITGTTTITTINTTGHSGNIITLVFAGILTVTRGSTIQISANFVTSSQDTLTICCDGNYWYEIGRSVN